MEDISLTWQQAVGIATIAFTVFAGVVGGLWTLMNGHVSHWKAAYEAKERELASVRKELEDTKREWTPPGQIETIVLSAKLRGILQMLLEIRGD